MPAKITAKETDLEDFYAVEPEPGGTPRWLPAEAIHYLSHTEQGRSIRQIARDVGCHASTISRRIRRFESRRDDPLIDRALDRLGARHFALSDRPCQAEEPVTMTATAEANTFSPGGGQIQRDAQRVLRRLAETGAVLAVAADMDKAVVVRDLPGGQSARTTVVDRETAEFMALQEWISCCQPGRISRYRLTSVGHAALKRFLSAEAANTGMAEAAQPFGEQHRDWAVREVEMDEDRPRQVKYNLAESPLTALARRRDKNGKPFLSDDLVAAGERLREDFELAQMGPRVAQNWDRFLTAGDRGNFGGGSGPHAGPEAARRRVSDALADLGPGLGDVVLRCCCFLEGIETTERDMGWSARSGKIVLRIALQRLKRHYEETGGKYAPMIG